MKKLLTILLLLCIQLNAAESPFRQDNLPLEDFLEGPTEAKKTTPAVNIDQARIIGKMIKYLELNQRDTSVINLKGVCNGLAFLAQYYASLNLEDEFFVALESMSAWNEKKETLKTATRIPYMYANLGKLFEQWINDISWFQQSYIQVASLKNLEISHQRRRIQQFDMIKRSNDDRKIALLSSPIMYKGLSKDQLAELVEIWSWYPNTIVEFGGQRHATSSRVLADGSICYYDPNMPVRLKPVASPQDLARFIQETKYKLLEFPYEKMTIEIMAYQYVDKGYKPYIPTSVQAIKYMNTGNQSPNGFTPFHLAIYANDLEYFRTLLKQSSLDPNQPDKMGVTPLYLATQLWKKDFVKELLNNPMIDLYKPTRQSPILAAIANYNIEAAVMLINQGANLFVTTYEKLSIEQILQEKNYVKLLELPAGVICCMNQEELEFVKELCRRVPGLTQIRDAYGHDLLYYAALFENYALYEVLLNADLH
jgi:ankyrin repeat protein